MPIQINLLAEAQAAEEQRRKDPVKRVFYGAGFVVFLAVLWGLTLQLKLMSSSSQLSTLQAQWNSIEKEYEEVVAQQREAIEAEGKLAALDRLTTNRFLWGTVLNAVQRSLNGIDHVEVARLKTEQQFKLNEESAPKTPGQKEAKKTYTSTERISLLVEATDYSAQPQPGAMVNRYKEAIANVPYFRDNLVQTNGVRLITLSPPQTSGAFGSTFVRFSLQCFFPEQTR